MLECSRSFELVPEVFLCCALFAFAVLFHSYDGVSRRKIFQTPLSGSASLYLPNALHTNWPWHHPRGAGFCEISARCERISASWNNCDLRVSRSKLIYCLSPWRADTSPRFLRSASSSCCCFAVYDLLCKVSLNDRYKHYYLLRAPPLDPRRWTLRIVRAPAGDGTYSST